MQNLTTLSDSKLIETINNLVYSEREALCEVVAYLYEIETRTLYLGLGYSSLFAYCTVGLGYSEGAAYRRIQAARALRDHPDILEKLQSGDLSLCALSEISRARPEARPALIEASVGKSKAAVRELVEQAAPVAPIRHVAEKISVRREPATALFQGRADPARESARITKRYTVTLELTEDEYHLLEEVQQISGERLRSRAVVKALKLYRRLRSPHERSKRRAARIKKKQDETGIAFAVKVEKSSPPRTVTRHIPVEVRDQVTIRDGGQCTFLGPDGQRCTERLDIQLDHLRPFSIGGEHVAENLRICCGAHNRFAYQQFMHGRALQPDEPGGR